MSRPIEPRIDSLAPDEVHVWLVRAELIDVALLARYEQLLCDEERVRWLRYRVESARTQFLIARALVRTTLSHYYDVPPAAWRFTANEYGRPEIAAPEVLGRLRFNLSHTHGLLACAVVWERDIGLDVEFIDRRSGGVHLAQRYFAPSEVDDLLALPESEQRPTFFDYWTLKEAYIKARGKGLAIPLADFSYHLRAGQPPTISFVSGFDDDPADWQFTQSQVSPAHRLALAVRCALGPSPLRVRLAETVPLGEASRP